MNQPRRSLALYVLGVVFFYPWELAQAPLFAADMGRAPWLHCFIASLGDGLLVLAIFAIGSRLRRKRNWFLKPDFLDYLLTLIIGGTIGVVVEWIAVFGLRLWSYQHAMPLIPTLNVGIAPVLATLALPIPVMRLAAVLNQRWQR